MKSATSRWIASLILASLVTSSCTGVPIRRGYEQTYPPARENWLFRDRFPEIDRMFNGFDYGHAIVYERLVADPIHGGALLEGPDFTFVTQQLLRDPPRLPVVERAIGPHYGTLVPEVVAMFEWAHMLHRQVYDAWALTDVDSTERDARIARAVAYYRSRRDLALSSSPKSMALMDGQPYSLTFHRQNPRFSELLWSYHWFQMALYEALMTTPVDDEQAHALHFVVDHFWQLVHGLPEGPPLIMPMSAAVAPRFAARYPEAAIIFDNLHALHDVVADILASPIIPRESKRAAILAAAATYRDTVTATTTRAEWLDMARMMNLDAMGGAALGARSAP